MELDGFQVSKWGEFVIIFQVMGRVLPKVKQTQAMYKHIFSQLPCEVRNAPGTAGAVQNQQKHLVAT